MVQVKVVSRRRVRRPGHLSRPASLLVLALTLWPLVYFGLFIVLWARIAFAVVATAAPSPALPIAPGLLVAFFVGQLLTMILGVALLTFYLIHLFRNDQIDGNLKAAWAIGLFMGGVVAMPAYWYLYLWPATAPAAATPPPANARARGR